MTSFFAILMLAVVPVSYQGTVSIEPDKGSFQAQLAIIVKNEDAAPVKAVPFRFRTDFTVPMIHDEKGLLTWEWSGDRLKVHLRDPLPPGESTRIHVKYFGVVDNLPWDFITKAGVVLRGEEARWCPFIRRFFKSDFEVRIPEGWTVRATGELQEGRFVAEAAPSVLIVAAPDRVEHKSGAITLYISKANSKAAPGMLEAAGKALALFAELFGPPPSANLVIFEVPGFAGGYANQGLVLVHPKMVESFLGEEPEECWVAHEICHQWWGNTIFGHPWLLEGLARYGEVIYVERFFGQDTAAQRLEKYKEIADQARPGLTIRDTDWSYQQDHFRVSYNRGALVHHRLRRWLGDQDYFSLLRSFLATHRFEEVTLDDFFESVCTLKPRVEVKAFYDRFIAADFDVYTGEPRKPWPVMSWWVAVVILVSILLAQALLDIILLRKTSSEYRRLFRHPPYSIAAGVMGGLIAAEIVLGPNWVLTYFVIAGLSLSGFAFGVRYGVHRHSNPERWRWLYAGHLSTFAGMALVANAFWSLLGLLATGLLLFLWKPVR